MKAIKNGRKRKEAEKVVDGAYQLRKEKKKGRKGRRWSLSITEGKKRGRKGVVDKGYQERKKKKGVEKGR